MTTAEALEEMLDISAEYAERMGMEPYYMYRQKIWLAILKMSAIVIPQGRHL